MPRVTITVPEKSPQPYRFDLKREIVTVGRGQDNDIVIGCGSVSGKHSEMHRVKGGYHLIDVGSTNGIKIDGIRHQTVVLHTGMTVKLGDVEFGFSLNEEELAVLASESEPTAKHVVGEDEDFDEEEIEDEVTEKKDSKKEKISEKTHSKVDEKKHEEKYEEKKKDDDGPDQLPDLPVRLNKRKEKEDQEAEKKKKAEKEERAQREEQAKKEARAEKREKRERSPKSEKGDEYSESKAVTIGSGFILFTLIAVAGAFFYGASTRHEKDTGDSLLKGIVNKEDAKTDAPKDVEDKPDGGAE